jgi:hypothetical protein
MWNKNTTRFYYKEEIEQNYDKKTYPKLVLNRLKVLNNYILIYIHWGPDSKKEFKKLQNFH